MTVVDINDIEDLILAKHEIDVARIENGEIEGRSDLNQFIKDYATPNYVYLIGDDQIPFTYVKVNNKDYLFVTENKKELINIVKNKLKLLKYDLNNLVKIPRNELAVKIDLDNVIIYNNNYYM